VNSVRIDPRTVESLLVHKGDDTVGELQRTRTGARFAYSSAQVALGDSAGRRVALRLPVRAEPHEVHGDNLHPFFAGLLPEGLRFDALVRRTKTSADDLFTLLTEVGRDAVGDVWVTPTSDAPGKSEAEGASGPDLAELSRSTFAELFQSLLEEGETVAVPGVRPKVSTTRVTLPLRGREGRHQYLLKLAPQGHPRLAENEAFFMRLARSVGIETAEVRLVHDAAGQAGLLVQRFDRRWRGADAAKGESSDSFERLHVEDSVQLLGLYPAEKYRLSLGEVMEALEATAAPLVERLRLLERLAFAYLIADGDLHGKNISLLEGPSGLRLSPAYDVHSTLPYGDHHQALKIEGRDQDLRRSHFVAFGGRHGLRAPAIEHTLDQLVERVARGVPRLPEIGLSERQTSHLERTIRTRLGQLS
jgi:serine/threonine-protein kinase HipA